MAENKGFSKNMQLLAYHDLDEKPGFQMAKQMANDRWYLYITARAVPGWHIPVVTEPSNPRYVRFVEGPPEARTIKMKIADGIMITTVLGVTIYYKGEKGRAFLSY